MELDKTHFEILRKARKKSYICPFDDNWDRARYLENLGLVSLRCFGENGVELTEITITEKGKGELYCHTDTRKRANIALVLSIIAIVLSLLTTFTPFPDWTKEFIRSLF